MIESAEEGEDGLTSVAIMIRAFVSVYAPIKGGKIFDNRKTQRPRLRCVVYLRVCNRHTTPKTLVPVSQKPQMYPDPWIALFGQRRHCIVDVTGLA